MHQRDLVLCRPQARIGLGQRVVPDGGLAHPDETRPAPRRHLAADQGREANMARLGHQHGAKAGGQGRGPCLTRADGGELLREAGAGRHRQEDCGPIHTGQSRFDRLA
jgi:hypothetical protein